MQKKYKLMAVFLTLFLISMGCIGYLHWKSAKGESLHLKTKGKEIIDQAASIPKHEENHPFIEWANQNGYDVDKVPDNLLDQVDKTPLDVIMQTFGAVYFGTPYLFSQNFDAEQFEKDLMKIEKLDKKSFDGEKDSFSFLMKKLSRNGKLNDIKYINTKDNNDGSVEVRMQLVFNDKKIVKTKIKLKKVETTDYTTYFITTSIWDLIKRIEK